MRGDLEPSRRPLQPKITPSFSHRCPYYEEYAQRVSRWSGKERVKGLEETSLYSELATFQLWMRNLEGYSNTRNLLVKRFEKLMLHMNRKDDLLAIYQAIGVICLSESEGDQHKIAIKKLLDHAYLIRTLLDVEEEEELAQKLTRSQIKGAALYRLGRYKEALSEFQKANNVLNNGGANAGEEVYQHLEPWGMLFMAMTQHRLGNQDEAVRLLKLGESNLKAVAPSEVNPVIEGNFGGEVLTQWVVYKEAKALISKP